MKAGAHLMERSKVRQATHVRDAAGMHDRGADVVNELPLDQLLAIPNGVEHLAHRERRDRVTSNHFERLLIVGRRCIFEPEEPEWLEIAGEARSFDWRHAVMAVVQKLDLRAMCGSQLVEKLRHHVQISGGI